MPAYHMIDGPNDTAFVFCDHASNHVPDFVGDLGLAEPEMSRHIAWDIGAEAVAHALCKHLSCAALICGFSRLVIDANREPEAAGLIPAESDGTIIPANVEISTTQREARKTHLYDTYHNALGQALDERPDALAISVHSFTPQLRGQPRRQTDIGLLVKEDTETAERFRAAMSRVAPNLCVEFNQPYSAHDLNFTVDHNVVPRGLRHLAIEIRQDHIADRDDAARMADWLARAIDPLT